MTVANLIRLVKRFEPKFSAVDGNVLVAAERILFKCSGSSFTFSYVKNSDSRSLSFFTLFGDVSVLASFLSFFLDDKALCPG